MPYLSYALTLSRLPSVDSAGTEVGKPEKKWPSVSNTSLCVLIVLKNHVPSLANLLDIFSGIPEIVDGKLTITLRVKNNHGSVKSEQELKTSVPKYQVLGGYSSEDMWDFYTVEDESSTLTLISGRVKNNHGSVKSEQELKTSVPKYQVLGGYSSEDMWDFYTVEDILDSYEIIYHAYLTYHPTFIKCLRYTNNEILLECKFRTHESSTSNIPVQDSGNIMREPEGIVEAMADGESYEKWTSGNGMAATHIDSQQLWLPAQD
ncbi:hypothetical protein STEG23_004512 [Scotinomys teguina]